MGLDGCCDDETTVWEARCCLREAEDGCDGEGEIAEVVVDW